MTRAKRHTEFGRHVTRLVRRMAETHHWTIGRAMQEIADLTGYDPSTVYRWRQGRLRPPNDVVLLLAQIGRREASLSRDWGRDLLRSAAYPGTKQAVEEIWGLRDQRDIPNNLPYPNHTLFVGRQEEIARLMTLLSPDHQAYLISVDGIGGVGKTALVLETAYRCLRASTGEQPRPGVPTFEAIVFTSAKQQYLTPDGILARRQTQRTLQDIFLTISRTLNRPDIIRTTPEEQPERVRSALSDQRTLLIVDNLETITDQETILSFLYDLPRPTKAIITTRHRIAPLLAPIHLRQLSEADSIALINHLCEENDVTLTAAQTHLLFERTGGIPAALIYSIGQIAAGYSVETVLERLIQADGDVVRFCFEDSVRPLRGGPAHHLLMAMSMFPKHPVRDAVVHVAGLSQDHFAAEEGLAVLQKLSLARYRDGRYDVLPLTREYAQAELTAHPNFEREARERWVQWYMDFIEKHGGKDWGEFQIEYDYIEEEWENILAVLDWCAANERYEEIAAVWKYDGNGVDNFSNIYGHWNDRLLWQEWLSQAAERRGDWPVAIEAILAGAWVLTMTGKPSDLEKAQAMLDRGWELLEQANSPRLRMSLGHGLGVLYVRRKDYQHAIHWFNVSAEARDDAGLVTLDKERSRVAVMYWYGLMAYQKGEYTESRRFFDEVMHLGEEIGWQRAVVYARNWLADIAIERGNLDEALVLLQGGLPVAERNRDLRRIAFYKYSFARLEQARGNYEAALRWGAEALKEFEHLNMYPEAEAARQLLDGLRDTMARAMPKSRTRQQHHPPADAAEPD